MANAEIRLVLKFEPNNVPANEIVAICDYIEADIENEIQMNHEEWRGRIATVRKWLLDSLQQEESAFWECSKCGKLVFRDRVRCSFCDATRTFPCPECQSEMPGHHANYCSLYKK